MKIGILYLVGHDDMIIKFLIMTTPIKSLSTTEAVE